MSETGKLETPLHYLRGSRRDVADGAAGLVVEEVSPCVHLSLRGPADSIDLRQALSSVVGLELPDQPLSCQRRGDASIFWQGPTEWMLVLAGSDGQSLQDDLRRALAGANAGAIIDVTGGQTLLRLSGSAVTQVLQKSCGYDFHPDNFPPGKCVQTTFAKAGALVARLEQDCIELLVRRSFCDYIGEWLLDAGAEFGVRISD
jgi:sarcosine oxidase subunit gamma